MTSDNSAGQSEATPWVDGEKILPSSCSPPAVAMTMVNCLMEAELLLRAPVLPFLPHPRTLPCCRELVASSSLRMGGILIGRALALVLVVGTALQVGHLPKW